IALVEVFDDGQRLGEAPPLVGERGNQLLGVERAVVRRALLAPAEVNGGVLVGESLKRKRNAYAIRCGRAEVAVELHKWGQTTFFIAWKLRQTPCGKTWSVP